MLAASILFVVFVRHPAWGIFVDRDLASAIAGTAEFITDRPRTVANATRLRQYGLLVHKQPPCSKLLPVNASGAEVLKEA